MLISNKIHYFRNFLIPIYRDFRGVSQMLQEHEDKSFTFAAVKMWY